MTAVEVLHGARTDVGRVREANEDSYLAAPPVFVVADGMGGHEGGDVASAIVVEEFERLATDGYDAADAEAAVVRTLGAAQARILEYAAEQRDSGVPDRRHAGTTVVGALLADGADGPEWLVVNIGDSRAYRWSGGRLEQVSKDHSMVQRLVDQGEITDAEAGTHPHRHVITRALGDTGDSEPDFFRLGLDEVERLVLCSDGITGMVDDAALAGLLAEHDDPRDAADSILEAALAAGGEDNATIVVVDVVGQVADDAAAAYDAVEERRHLEAKLGALP